MNMLKTIKNSLLIGGIAMFGLSSCTKDDPTPGSAPSNEYTKSGNLTADETWTAANIYTLNGKVIVNDGVTLTIEPGTIIKAEGGQGTAASALVVAQGGKINAVGTASSPIIFTSVTDNIAIGEKVGTNLQRDDNQLWGGIILLGKAPVSAENGDTQANIEGIPPEEGYGQYGGSISDDNSGTMAFVSIRHGGISIGDGNEINGLTLGGVGSGTSLSNIEVYATLDDGVEFFGGTVNLDKFLSYYQGDDGVDIDQNFAGTVSTFAVIHGDGISTDEGLEADGPEGSTNVHGLFTLINGYCILEGTDGSAADFKSDAQGHVMNVTFQSQTSKPVKFRTKFDADCGNREDAYQHLANDPATLWFTDCKLDGSVEVYDGDSDDSNPTTCPSALEDDNTNAISLVSTNGTGASFNISTTFSWTCAGLRGQL